ncbi:hypothetical protein K432DRAFT_456030 [Lepidopterella palustris CBS 459.81]|uniref:Uncharacterized protein n=1 Tax=Lepidopterella palustris CBS 459.81 TaxID=1314670 RepID=A0A8E2E836_9PEZI|nr:hypothetical protein K432DRAFT_456030 [Lepidopterella palustris CBS 459.81]
MVVVFQTRPTSQCRPQARARDEAAFWGTKKDKRRGEGNEALEEVVQLLKPVPSCSVCLQGNTATLETVGLSAPTDFQLTTMNHQYYAIICGSRAVRGIAYFNYGDHGYSYSNILAANLGKTADRDHDGLMQFPGACPTVYQLLQSPQYLTQHVTAVFTQVNARRGLAFQGSLVSAELSIFTISVFPGPYLALLGQTSTEHRMRASCLQTREKRSVFVRLNLQTRSLAQRSDASPGHQLLTVPDSSEEFHNQHLHNSQENSPPPIVSLVNSYLTQSAKQIFARSELPTQQASGDEGGLTVIENAARRIAACTNFTIRAQSLDPTKQPVAPLCKYNRPSSRLCLTLAGLGVFMNRLVFAAVGETRLAKRKQQLKCLIP